jgi:DNA-directed RNA polymerase specialized sigma24 family protein
MQDLLLSRVEELVLRGATYGLTYDEIAAGLGLSREVVGRQVADAYSKMHRLAQRWPDIEYLPDSLCASLSVRGRP